MEEYTRDSLREMRRGEQQARQQKEKGSKFITFLIILLFLAAGIFYLATAEPAWLKKHLGFSELKAAVETWQQDLADAFQTDDTVDVQSIVDDALKEQNE